MSEQSSTDIAAQRLAELFKTPEVCCLECGADSQDLSKIESYRARFIREKANVDAQLKAGIRSQLEITQVVVRKLQLNERMD
jgi:hypothetical protein